MKLNIAICDDDERTLEDICYKLKTIINNCIIDRYYSGSSLIREKKNYDLVFLDIDMNELDGMMTARYIKTKSLARYLILLSKKTDYMEEAFKVRAFLYITKPIKASTICEALTSIAQEYRDRKYIVIKYSSKVVSVNLDDIIYFEAYGDGTYIFTAENVYTTSEPLKKWLSVVENMGFFQVHRSYIVSLDYVKNIRKYEIELKGMKASSPVSHRKFAKFKKCFLEYASLQQFVCNAP